jgi:hypothetical protein
MATIELRAEAGVAAVAARACNPGVQAARSDPKLTGFEVTKTFTVNESEPIDGVRSAGTPWSDISETKLCRSSLQAHAMGGRLNHPRSSGAWTTSPRHG